jgi:hypothetical protein
MAVTIGGQRRLDASYVSDASSGPQDAAASPRGTRTSRYPKIDRQCSADMMNGA